MSIVNLEVKITKIQIKTNNNGLKRQPKEIIFR